MLKTALTTLALLAAGTTAQAVTFTFDAGTGNGIGFQLVDGVDDFALSFTGSNSPSVGTGDVSTFSATATENTTYSIFWSYTTFDLDGSGYDPFGFFVGGTFTQLTEDGAPYGTSQTGELSLSVQTGDSFGFYIDSTDDVFGPGFASVSGSVTAVPLPASGLLLLAGLGGLALRRRKKALPA